MPGENLKTASLTSIALQEFWRGDAPLIAQIKQLYTTSRAERWGVARAAFAEALRRSACKRFAETVPSAAEAASYLESLHLEDLALACGCSQGNPQAWEYFFQNYREILYAAARAIVGRASVNEAQARELADSLYAELYGGNLRGEASADRVRHSLFVYFHGRSKLSTWLRAILAQRHVDVLRAGRRTGSLDATEHAAGAGSGDDARYGARDKDGYAVARVNAARFVSPDPDRERVVALMQAVLVATLSALPPRDRLRLALYYVQDLTLAQIGRILGEHEATVSRHLERVRKDVRNRVEESLRAKRLSDAEMRLCFGVAQEEWPFDLTKALETGASLLSAVPREPGSGKQRGNSAIRKDR